MTIDKLWGSAALCSQASVYVLHTLVAHERVRLFIDWLMRMATIMPVDEYNQPIGEEPRIIASEGGVCPSPGVLEVAGWVRFIKHSRKDFLMSSVYTLERGSLFKDPLARSLFDDGIILTKRQLEGLTKEEREYAIVWCDWRQSGCPGILVPPPSFVLEHIHRYNYDEQEDARRMYARVAEALRRK